MLLNARLIAELFAWASLAVLCGLGSYKIARTLFDHSSPGQAQSASNSHRQGDSAPVIYGLDYSKTNRTTVIAVSANCHFCLESMPFYARLAHAVSRRENTKLVLLFSDSAKEAAQFVKLAELSDYMNRGLSVISGQDLAQFDIAGTPTLFIVNRTGHIERIVRGKLPITKQSEILGIIAR